MIKDDFAEKVTSWQQRVVVKKGKQDAPTGLQALQSELEIAARGGTGALVEYLRKELDIKDRSDILEPKQDIPLLLRRLTVAEAQRVPVELEQELAKEFGNSIKVSDATRPAFWTAAHIIWVEEDLLEEGWAPDLVGKDVDRTARNVCRNLGGLPHIRGKTSVLTDCPLARAWWRVRIAHLIADFSEGRLQFFDTHNILHNSAVWTILTGELVRRLAVMNEPRALAALVTYFSENRKVLNKKSFQNMIHHLASYSTVINFSSVPFEDMMEICSWNEGIQE